MKVVLGGVRGTSCVAHPDFMKYGGDTTALLVEGRRGERVLIDAGTGIRRLAERVGKDALRSPVLLLITHFHLDHLMGLPSLPSLYRKEASFTMASPRKEGHTLRSVVSRIMSAPLWPVAMDELHASIRFLNWTRESSFKPYRFGSLEVRWCPVHHPGGCTAYRIDEPATGGSLVFATDVEWGLSTAGEKKMFARLCTEPAPAKLLIMDGQFEDGNASAFKGWGHSTWQQTVALARELGVGRALISHHAPEETDRALDRTAREVRKAWRRAGLARAGQEIVL